MVAVYMNFVHIGAKDHYIVFESIPSVNKTLAKLFTQMEFKLPSRI